MLFKFEAVIGQHLIAIDRVDAGVFPSMKCPRQKGRGCNKCLISLVGWRCQNPRSGRLAEDSTMPSPSWEPSSNVAFYGFLKFLDFQHNGKGSVTPRAGLLVARGEVS
jgi:hypothetical protein